MSEQEARNCDLAESLATEPREAIESEVRSVFLAGYTLSAHHRPYDGEDDRGEHAAWLEYRKLFDPVSRLSVVWCRCGDGIEDPTCKTCYMTETRASRIPGITAIHAIITPNCRRVPRPELNQDPAFAAFEEAVERLRKEYRAIVDIRGDAFNAHVVLTIESPASPTQPEGEAG